MNRKMIGFGATRSLVCAFAASCKMIQSIFMRDLIVTAIIQPNGI